MSSPNDLTSKEMHEARLILQRRLVSLARAADAMERELRAVREHALRVGIDHREIDAVMTLGDPVMTAAAVAAIVRRDIMPMLADA